MRSLRAQTTSCRVVVVDNGSTDESVAMIRSEFSEVELIELPQNLGFGRALNHAFALVEGEEVFLLNNDIVCEPEFIERMLARLQPGIDMVAGVLLMSDDPGLIDSAGVIADRRTLMAFDYLRGRPAETAFRAPAPLAPTGGAALYRRSALERVGGFDERIFAYYEDLDLALRLRVEGSRCALAADARVTHERSATLGKRAARKYALTGWSRGYLIRRYRVMSDPGGCVRTLVMEAIVCAGQALLDHTFQGLVGRFRGWRDARGLEPRPLPLDGLPGLSTRQAIRERLRER